MKVLGIYGSPREHGNSDELLNKVLEGAQSAGAEVYSIYVRNLRISGCLECTGCSKSGKCIINDDMQSLYSLMEEADVIFLASPIFFYAVPAQLKVLIDRCQAMWAKRMIERKSQPRRTNRGRGYLIAVGATKGRRLFEGARLTARCFFDALNKHYEGGLFFRGVEGKGAIFKYPEALTQALKLGKSVVEKTQSGTQDPA